MERCLRRILWSYEENEIRNSPFCLGENRAGRECTLYFYGLSRHLPSPLIESELLFLTSPSYISLRSSRFFPEERSFHCGWTIDETREHVKCAASGTSDRLVTGQGKVRAWP